MRTWHNPLSRLLAPPCCVFCTAPLASGRVCAACRADLPWQDAVCPRCAEPFAALQPPGIVCAACLLQPPPWTLCVAPLAYAFPLDAALQRLKFRRALWIAPAVAELLLPSLQARLANVDALCPVPLHRFRHLQRGYNQAREICRPLARATGLPLLNAVRRVRNTPPQSGLDRRARRRNLRRAFRLEETLLVRHPLIVDDILTTGETCRQLARVLLEGGAESVSVLVAARAAGGRYVAGANV